jgi:hypothetical protein
MNSIPVSKLQEEFKIASNDSEFFYFQLQTLGGRNKNKMENLIGYERAQAKLQLLKKLMEES